MADCILLSGVPVHPGDIERALGDHPAVEEAAVVRTVSDTDALTALVVVAENGTLTAQELLEFARERLSANEVPSSVVFVERLPRNSVGKLVRSELDALASTFVQHRPDEVGEPRA